MKEHSHKTSTIKGRTICKVVLVSCGEMTPHSDSVEMKSKQLPLPPSFSCSHTPGLFILSLSFSSLLSLSLSVPLFLSTLIFLLCPFRSISPCLAASRRCAVDVYMSPSVSPPHTVFIKMARRELQASAALVRCDDMNIKIDCEGVWPVSGRSEDQGC